MVSNSRDKIRETWPKPLSRALYTSDSISGWGSHSREASAPYLTAAAAGGMTRGDVDAFVRRLDKVLLKAKKSKGETEEKEEEK